MTLELMRSGATGTISVTANVAPGLMSKMCNLLLEGEFESARALDDQLAGLHKCLFLEIDGGPVGPLFGTVFHSFFATRTL